jgi:hypothetical protein
LGAALVGQKRYADAEPLLISAYEGINLPQQTMRTLDRESLSRKIMKRLVDLYDGWGRPDEAAKWRAKLTDAK